MSYSAYRTITVASGTVSSNLTDFPLLVSLTETDLATTANGGIVTNSSGFDIVFSSDNAGANLLAWEVESYNAATGALIVWVKIPAVSHTADTVIYMCYGNSSITTPQGDSTAVWA
ncbi:MAG: DUF2341 domain-containing protein, partial [Candidatus Saccharimonadales bacterium]